MRGIFYLMGKSASGKDAIYGRIRKARPGLKSVVTYTTRPVRDGESEGVEYHFTDEAGLLSLKEAGRIIECREYDTACGVWKYFTADDGQFDADGYFLGIGTLQSYVRMKAYFGENRVFPLYIEVRDDGERLSRALLRERAQKRPRYDELCRRFLADAADFSDEKIREAGITRRFVNDDSDECAREIIRVIDERMSDVEAERGI